MKNVIQQTFLIFIIAERDWILDPCSGSLILVRLSMVPEGQREINDIITEIEVSRSFISPFSSLPLPSFIDLRNRVSRSFFCDFIITATTSFLPWVEEDLRLSFSVRTLWDWQSHFRLFNQLWCGALIFG